MFAVLCGMVLFVSCSDDDDNNDTVTMRVQIAVRVDSRPPRSLTLFGGRIYLGEGHEDNWQITQEFYRLYADKITVKKEDVVKLNNTPFKSNSEYARKFLEIDYPYDSKKVFEVTADMDEHSVLLILK